MKVNWPAVEWLERDYDKWELVKVLDISRGVYLLRVKASNPVNGNKFFVGRNHDPLWIQLKGDEDWYAEVSDERFREMIMCRDCAEGTGHRCFECEEPVMHMEGGSCHDCTMRLWGEYINS